MYKRYETYRKFVLHLTHITYPDGPLKLLY